MRDGNLSDLCFFRDITKVKSRPQADSSNSKPAFCADEQAFS